jgi:repressor LexA
MFIWASLPFRGSLFLQGASDHTWATLSIFECQMTAPSAKPTAKQGQYLAFIYNYTKINGRVPAQADMQRYFDVSPPTVHQMVLKLERAGFITREPGMPRSLTILLDPDEIPRLE